MLRATSRRVLSAQRGWPSSLGPAVGANLPSPPSEHNRDRNGIHAPTTRRAMSSQPDGSGGGWWSKVPGFGSKPIPPKDDDATTIDFNPTSGGEDIPSVEESLSKILPDVTDATIATPEPVDTAAAIAAEIAAFEPTWWPSDQALVLLNWINETSGLPCYAVTIGATTLAFRAALLPLFIKSQRSAARMAHVQPELKQVMDEMKKKTDEVQKKGETMSMADQMRFRQQMTALYKRYDVTPLGALTAPLVSMPVFMSMFFALRQAPDFFPDLLANGGMLWFPDLTAADPYCIMPVLSAGTFLAMTEVGKEQMMASDPARGRIMINVMRALAVVMVPLTMNFNAAIFVYWTTNNSWTFFQSLFLKQPAVRKYFGIWEPPKPPPGQEAKNVFDEIADTVMRKKKKEEPNALTEDRVKAHNEIIAQQKMVKKRLMEKEGLKAKRMGKGKK